MTVRTITPVGAVVLALAVAGCGGSGTDPTRRESPRHQASDARERLSPVARDLLGRAEALVGSVAGTIHTYASGSMSANVVEQRLAGERVRARGLIKDAEALPGSDG